MNGVVIRHCRLNVVRRGGWSWGPDPRGLLQRVVGHLPTLLTHSFAGALPEDTDLDITQPLKLRIPIALNTLLALGPPGQTAAPMSDLHFEENTAATAILAQLRTALVAALGPHASKDFADAPKPESGVDGKVIEDAELTHSGAIATADPAPLLMALLTALLETGRLPIVLSKCTEACLRAWHELLICGRIETQDAHDRKALVTLIESRTLPETASMQLLLATRLDIAVTAAGRLGIPPQSALVRELLDRFLPLDRQPLRDPQDDKADIENTSSKRVAAKPSSSRARESEQALEAPGSSHLLAISMPAPFTQGEVDISCALPFLILGPLQQIGFLDLLSAQAGMLGLTARLPAFATALAYKVLQPPQRGWRRDPASQRAATVAAGLGAPLEETALLAFARDATGLCTPLEACLTQALMAGRSSTSPPLLLHRLKPSGDWLLLETEGLFPLARDESLAAIFDIARRATTLPLLVEGQWLTPAVRQCFDAEGITFITDSPPIRGETWRRFQVNHRRYHTNEAQLPAGQLRGAASRFPAAAELAGEQVGALIESRHAITLAGETALERMVTQAATVALGALAWTLWGERETVDPVLALTRFSDLDARVCFGEDTVRVRLPLGRRHQDLYRHNLLHDVHQVLWLRGRTLLFTGG